MTKKNLKKLSSQDDYNHKFIVKNDFKNLRDHPARRI